MSNAHTFRARSPRSCSMCKYTLHQGFRWRRTRAQNRWFSSSCWYWQSFTCQRYLWLAIFKRMSISLHGVHEITRRLCLLNIYATSIVGFALTLFHTLDNPVSSWLCVKTNQINCMLAVSIQIISTAIFKHFRHAPSNSHPNVTARRLRQAKHFSLFNYMRVLNSAQAPALLLPLTMMWIIQ